MFKVNKTSIIYQVAMLFLAGIVLSGILTYLSQRNVSEREVTERTETTASQIAYETMTSVKEYPAYRWLINYWYHHYEEMNIDYDESYGKGTKTEEKCRLFNKRHPSMFLKYTSTEEVKKLPERDQKLYAEIIYSWLITRIDQIKQSYNIDYLFCVLSDEPYDKQFFIFSGADEGEKRGTKYEEVYPLGTLVDVNESLSYAMKSAAASSSYLADAGSYVDYYSLFDTIDGHAIFIGITYDLTKINERIASEVSKDTRNAITYQTIFALICLCLIYFYVLDPLKKIQHNIHLYSDDKDSQSGISRLSTIKSNNEIGALKDDMINLIKELDDYIGEIRTITSEKERISAELELASRIQLNTLPNLSSAFPDNTEFDVFASMDPAKEVGGDFYDTFKIDEDHLVIVIADVSGKGIPAALFMMVSMILIENFSSQYSDPAHILEQLNNKICENNPEEMFVSVWLGLLELSTGTLTAANAGHEYPVLRLNNGDFKLFKDKHGFVIGGMEGMRYRNYTIQLKPGDQLFIYTDGLPEATNANNEMFTVKRMVNVLNQNQAHLPKEILTLMQESVDEFVDDAEQFDDLTMLCLTYNGKTNER